MGPEPLRDLLNMITWGWLTVVALHCVRRAVGGSHNLAYPILILHYLICGLPLVLDFCVGLPSHENFPGFYAATRDTTTCLIYCGYVAVTPLLVLALAGRARIRTSASPAFANAYSALVRKHRFLFVLMMILPAAALLLAPDCSIYRTYAPVERLLRWQSTEVLVFHAYLVRLAVLSVLAGFSLVLASRHMAVSLALVSPFWFLDAWLVGKRSVVAVILALLVYVIHVRGRRRHLSWVMGIASLIGFLGFSVYYQKHLRGLEFTLHDWVATYDGFRIDFGRDNPIKLAIFAERHPRYLRLLDHRGQSLLIYATLPIPRSYWPEKPLSYGMRMACEAKRIPPEYLGWGMTTSIFDEAIANTGWPGLLLGPLLVGLICRMGNRSSDTLVRLLTLIVGALFMVVHLSAFPEVFLAWLGVLGYDRLSRRHFAPVFSPQRIRNQTRATQHV